MSSTPSLGLEVSNDTVVEAGHDDPEHSSHDAEHGSAHGDTPSAFLCIPFVLLLLLIAVGPLFFEHFWHKNYPVIAIFLAVIVVGYYIFVMGNINGPIHALEEYVPFISLLAALYIASGGIGIKIDREVSPFANVALLLTGAVIANLIGTTGASMLLVRPFIRLNKTRIKPYHIIFFIFIVSNVGGSLTPIGDPPLFLGFLKGVPFFWTLEHNVVPWAFAVTILLAVFYAFDIRNKSVFLLDDEPITYSNKVSIVGGRNFIWLLIVIIAVFIDPNVEGMEWLPAIDYHGKKISFIKEIIWLTVAFLSYRLARKEAHKINEFSFEPIREVAFIFIGIFGTMTPALELVGSFAKSPAGQQLINPDMLYWGTGLLSGFLDNAPTYVNFVTAAISAKGGNISNLEDVRAFAAGEYPDSIILLKSISIAAVFFGAMTYIGNGPNFMVKSIAEQIGIKMPSFFGYIIRFSIPVLLPILILTWLIFF
ncbi:MAG: sodium:proton antiporter [Bacteroidota bacterium]